MFYRGSISESREQARRKAISIASKKMWSTNKFRKKAMEGIAMHWSTPDAMSHAHAISLSVRRSTVRKKIAESVKKYWTPQNRATQSARMKSIRATRPECWINQSAWIKGKKKTTEVVARMQRAQLDSYARGNRRGCGPNGWHRREYKGLVLKSSYELAFVKWCDKNNIEWRYEPKRFRLEMNGTYRPDFYLPKYKLWIETKGAFLPKPMAKYFEFQKLYPEKKIWLLDLPVLREAGILES